MQLLTITPTAALGQLADDQYSCTVYGREAYGACPVDKNESNQTSGSNQANGAGESSAQPHAAFSSGLNGANSEVANTGTSQSSDNQKTAIKENNAHADILLMCLIIGLFVILAALFIWIRHRRKQKTQEPPHSTPLV